MRLSTVYPRRVGSIWRKEHSGTHIDPPPADFGSIFAAVEKLWMCRCYSAEKNSPEATIWGGCDVWWQQSDSIGSQISPLFIHTDSYVAEISIRWTKGLFCPCVRRRLLTLSVKGNHALCDSSRADCCELIKLISASLQQKKTEDVMRMMSVSQQD